MVTLRKSSPFHVPAPPRVVAHKIAAALALACLVAVAALAPVARAQQDTTPGWPLHDSSPVHATADLGGSMPLLIADDESCLLWTAGKKNGPTVSAANLSAPPAAHDEYKKACTELRAKHLDLAEQHLRKALDLAPQYPGAWALLGQVLEAGQKIPEAKSACAQASTADAAFSPAYLCLSELSAQQSDWQHSLDFADRALALDPVLNPFGHFYMAIAQVHLGALSHAESSASDAIQADKEHRIPQAHLLLAQIYGVENQWPQAAGELRAYLKITHNGPDAAAVRKSLAEVEAKMQK